MLSAMSKTKRRPPAGEPARGEGGGKGKARGEGQDKGRPEHEPNEWNMRFAARCRALVKWRSMSLAALGRKADIGGSRWTNWSKGDHTVSVEEAARIAYSLGLTLDQLLAGLDPHAGAEPHDVPLPPEALEAVGIPPTAATGHEKSPAAPAPVGEGRDRALLAALAALEAAAAALRAVAAAEAEAEAAKPRPLAGRET
jgi:hypothetical protein